MAEVLPPRRTACDRCRSHKLRCIRDSESHLHDSCRRCLKSGIDCVTNASARIGRSESTLRGRFRNQPRQDRRNERANSSNLELCDATPVSVSAHSHFDSQIRTSANGSTGPDVTNLIRSSSEALYGTVQTQDSPSSAVLDPSSIASLPPPLNRREECERKLAGLHSTLVLDLNIVRESQTADKCTAIMNSPEFSHNYNFMIGHMLNSSARFIEILKYFVPSRSTASKEPVTCDVPTLLSIFTCYVYTMRIYRITFVCIYKSIMERDPGSPKLPPLFPGLQLAGYSLEPHVHLQVKVLVGVCEEMLGRIDDLLGIRNNSGDTQPFGLLARVGSSAMLFRSMLDEELAEQHKEGILHGSTRLLSDIMNSLKALRHDFN